MYIICKELSYQKMVDAIESSLKKGAEVKIIVDNPAYRHSRPDHPLNSLKKYHGMEVIFAKASLNIQTKFSVLGTSYAMTGAFNWGATDMRVLFDSVLAVTESDVVSRFKREFEYHWQNCEADNRSNQPNEETNDRSMGDRTERVRPQERDHPDPFLGPGNSAPPRTSGTWRLNSPRGMDREENRQRGNGTSAGMANGLLNMMVPDSIRNTVRNYVEPVNRLMDNLDNLDNLDKSFEAITGQKILPDELTAGIKKAKDIRDTLFK